MEPVLRILEVIARGGGPVDISIEGRWVEALKTIQWLAESTTGLELTADGRRALGDLTADLRMARRKTELA